MYLFANQAEGYTSPQVVVPLKESVAYLSCLVWIPGLFMWSDGDSMLGIFYWTSKKSDREKRVREAEHWSDFLPDRDCILEQRCYLCAETVVHLSNQNHF